MKFKAWRFLCITRKHIRSLSETLLENNHVISTDRTNKASNSPDCLVCLRRAVSRGGGGGGAGTKETHTTHRPPFPRYIPRGTGEAVGGAASCGDPHNVWDGSCVQLCTRAWVNGLVAIEWHTPSNKHKHLSQIHETNSRRTARIRHCSCTPCAGNNDFLKHAFTVTLAALVPACLPRVVAQCPACVSGY